MKRFGLTLIELLIVLAIVGILIGICIPAIQYVREVSNRIMCCNNLKQIVTSINLFHNANAYLPTNGGYDGIQKIKDVDGSLISVFTEDYISGKWYWGVGDPVLSIRDQTGSWGYMILPYLDQSAAWEKAIYETKPPNFYCSTRRSPIALVAKDDDRAKYHGGQWRWGKVDYAGNGTLFTPRPQIHRLSEINDGLSNTILIGEKALDPQYGLSGSWYWDEPYFLGGSDSTARKGFGLIPDRVGNYLEARENWGSAHSSGCQFAFADGSARLLKYSTSGDFVRSVLSPSGGEIISPD